MSRTPVVSCVPFILLKPHFITVCLFHYFTYTLLFFPLHLRINLFLAVVHFPILLSSTLLPLPSSTSTSIIYFHRPPLVAAVFLSIHNPSPPLCLPPLSLFYLSRSLRRLYSGLSIPLIRVLIIQLPSTTLAFLLSFPSLPSSLFPHPSPPPVSSITCFSAVFLLISIQPSSLQASLAHIFTYQGKNTDTHTHTYTDLKAYTPSNAGMHIHSWIQKHTGQER